MYLVVTGIEDEKKKKIKKIRKKNSDLLVPDLIFFLK